MKSLPPFQYQLLFSAMGGSGSTYLVRNLPRLFAEVGNKPDNAFRPRYPQLWACDFGTDQGDFHARAGGKFNSSGSCLEEVLPLYLEYLRDDPFRTAVFGTAAELGLLSALQVPKVVFLVRHPLDGYASWSKPQRHGDVIDALGGIDSPRAIRFYADRWVRVTDEILRLHELRLLGGVIRFEHAHYDASMLGLSQVFQGFDCNKRNRGALRQQSKELIREIVETNYQRIYLDDWTESIPTTSECLT